MVVYCKACGFWQDVSLVSAFLKALEPVVQAAAKFSAELNGQEYTEPPRSDTFRCPADCGEMVSLQSGDRIQVQPVIMALVTIPLVPPVSIPELHIPSACPGMILPKHLQEDSNEEY